MKHCLLDSTVCYNYKLFSPKNKLRLHKHLLIAKVTSRGRSMLFPFPYPLTWSTKKLCLTIFCCDDILNRLYELWSLATLVRLCPKLLLIFWLCLCIFGTFTSALLAGHVASEVQEVTSVQESRSMMSRIHKTETCRINKSYSRGALPFSRIQLSLGTLLLAA